MANRSGGFVFNMGTDAIGFADEGSVFTVTNAQTGIATAAAPTSFSATNPFLSIFNSASAGGKSMYIDYIRLIATAAGTGGASLQFSIVADGPGVDRYTSGGSSLTANIVNPNGNYGNSSNALVRAGNITAAAASTLARSIVGNGYLSGAIPVAGDAYVIKCGSVDNTGSLGISTIKNVTVGVPKIVVPPQGSLLVHLWLPSQSGASSYLPEVTWVER